MGRRHGRRHFAKLSIEGRDLTKVACEGGDELDWRGVATDRARWASLANKWVALHDIPWGTGRQLSIC